MEIFKHNLSIKSSELEFEFEDLFNCAFDLINGPERLRTFSLELLLFFLNQNPHYHCECFFYPILLFLRFSQNTSHYLQQ